MNESLQEGNRLERALSRAHVRSVAGVILFVLVLLIWPLFPTPAVQTPGWLAWLGRLHPLLVHFPVALAPLLLVFEGVLLWRKAARPVWLRLFWGITLGGALLSAAAGYLLFASGDYGGELAREHFWGAVVTMSLLIGAALLAEASGRRASRVYLVALGLGVAGMIYTGHHGGMLTHGETFLTEAMPVRASAEPAREKPRAELLVWDDLIFPAFEQRCMSCHNANKARGGLQLTSYQAMQAGGDSEAVMLAPGDPSSSELYRRSTLPAHDDDAMPPDGKTPLSEIEKSLIAWWIAEGARSDMTLGDGPADSSLNARLDRYIFDQAQRRRRRELNRKEALEQARRLDESFAALRIEVDAANDATTLSASMRIPPEPVDDDVVARLAAESAPITSLSLAGSDITDDALYHVSRLPQLRALYLAYTTIEGEGLVYLQEAPQLETLNLSHTATTNEAALYLTRMPALKSVYLYNTDVDSVMIEALRAFLPEVDIVLEEGPLHAGG